MKKIAWTMAQKAYKDKLPAALAMKTGVPQVVNAIATGIGNYPLAEFVRGLF